MQELELKIELKDWLVITIIGVVFSSLISTLIYFSTSKSLLHGALFGAVVGIWIASFSYLFITILNRYILPHIPKIFWGVFAALLSFFSGFLGTLCGFFMSTSLGVDVIQKISSNIALISLFLGVLTYLIGLLLYQFVKTSNKEKRIESELYKSRLSSLETQLNPHFLYNSLNSLAELLHSDKKRCEESIVELSSFLRDSMKEETLIPVKKEIENIQRYLYLENIRFENAIELKKRVEQKAKSVQIPKFSIQLLVENAIKHAFKGGSKRFIIEIEISQKNGLEVLVKNSGEIEEFTKGVGLKNLDERVRLLCKGRVYLKSRNPTTFCIEMRRCDESFSS